MNGKDGIILINKPKGYTSHDIVSIAKKTLNEKIGHTGTLDPNATGVLPLLIGKGTKLSKYLINHDKEYVATIKLGEMTETADSEGKIIKKEDVRGEEFNEDLIKHVLKSFIGEQTQIPPMYSAIKLNGKKLYEYARKGIEVEVKPRKIEIYSITLEKLDKEKLEIIFKVNCSKGTYIRSLCEDIAKELGTVGYMKELQRTKAGDFCIEDCVSVKELKENYEAISKKIISFEKFFSNTEKINLNNSKLNLFLNGVKLDVDLIDGIYSIYNNSSFIGIGVVVNKKLKRDIIL